MIDLGDIQTKKCTKCGKEKPTTLFNFKEGRKRLRPSCKECDSKVSSRWYRENKDRVRARCHEWYKENKEKSAEYTKKWREANRERARFLSLSNRRKRLYGISKEQYAQMVADAGGVCAICRRPFSGYPNIDHDHHTGAVRELLCSQCNKGLGNFGDDTSLMEAAIAYLKKHRQNHGVSQ